MFEKTKSFFAVQDMTEGKISHNIIRFSVPLLIGNFAQQLYQTVDAIIVGQSVPGGLAAIGTTGPIMNFMIIIFMALATGAGVMVSQSFGAKDYAKLRRIVANTIMLLVVSSLVLMAIVIPLAPHLLVLLNTPEEIIGMAQDYLSIIFIGIMGMALYNISSGILRGLGDSFSPLLLLILATLINTGLDIYFVWYLGWGVAGAAWATIIAQAISAVLTLVRLFGIDFLHPYSKEDMKPRWAIIKEIYHLGIPAGLTQGIFAIAMILVQNLINQMGTLVIEANTAVIRVDALAMMPNFTFGMAAMTFVGQNVGAGKLDRVHRGSKILSRMSLVVSILTTLAINLFGPTLLGLFSKDPNVILVGQRMFLVLSLGYIAVSQTQAFGGILRGAGNTMPSMWIALFTSIVIRTPLAYLMTYLSRSSEWPNGSPYWLQASLLIAWVLGAVATYAYYRFANWEFKSQNPLHAADLAGDALAEAETRAEFRDPSDSF